MRQRHQTNTSLGGKRIIVCLSEFFHTCKLNKDTQNSYRTERILKPYLYWWYWYWICTWAFSFSDWKIARLATLMKNACIEHRILLKGIWSLYFIFKYIDSSLFSLFNTWMVKQFIEFQLLIENGFKLN